MLPLVKGIVSTRHTLQVLCVHTSVELLKKTLITMLSVLTEFLFLFSCILEYQNSCGGREFNKLTFVLRYAHVQSKCATICGR